MGLFRSSSLMMLPGLKLKFFITILVISSSVIPPIAEPYESIWIESGSARPIAYETYTRTLCASLLATIDLATYLA